MTNAAPVALGGSAIAGLHPDVKAIVAPIGTKGARPGVEPPITARKAHRVELGMQLLRGTHGDALPPPLRAGMAMPSHANTLTRRSAGDMLGAETLSGVSAQTRTTNAAKLGVVLVWLCVAPGGTGAALRADSGRVR